MSKVEPVLDTWIFTEEKEERIVPLSLEMPEQVPEPDQPKGEQSEKPIGNA